MQRPRFTYLVEVGAPSPTVTKEPDPSAAHRTPSIRLIRRAPPQNGLRARLLPRSLRDCPSDVPSGPRHSDWRFSQVALIAAPVVTIHRVSRDPVPFTTPASAPMSAASIRAHRSPLRHIEVTSACSDHNSFQITALSLRGSQDAQTPESSTGVRHLTGLFAVRGE